MGYIKEPAGIDFVVESKDWTEAEKEEMRRIIANAKNKIIDKPIPLFRQEPMLKEHKNSQRIR